jgi:hypothetical protein
VPGAVLCSNDDFQMDVIRGAKGTSRSGGNSRAKLAQLSEASVPAACSGNKSLQTHSIEASMPEA